MDFGSLLAGAMKGGALIVKALMGTDKPVEKTHDAVKGEAVSDSDLAALERLHNRAKGKR